MKPVYSYLLAILAALMASLPVNATVIRVPDDRETIQSAIDSASGGDTILVAPGVYVENLRIDQPITLASWILITEDPAYIDSTVVDGDQRDCCLSIEIDEPTFVRGFTFRNGVQNYGGGIDLTRESQVVVEDVVITNCQAAQSGGGFYASYYTRFRLSRARIVNNSVGREGGGLKSFADETHIIDCFFAGNQADGAAAISISGDGGIERTVIVDNESQRTYGAIRFEGDEIAMDRVTVAHNRAAEDSAGGGSFNPMREGSIVNCVFWGNEGGEHQLTIARHENQGIEFGFCAIQGGMEAVQIVGRLEEDPEGIIDDNPLFRSPEDLDYRLQAESPCIDSGVEDMVDADGTRADMGGVAFIQRSAWIGGVVRTVRGDSLLTGASVTLDHDGLDFPLRDITDRSGEWRVWTPIPADSVLHRYRVVRPPYLPLEGELTVYNRDSLNLEFEMGIGVLAATPPELELTLSEGDSGIATTVLGNTGTAPLSWRAEWRGLREMVSEAGAIVDEFGVGAAINDDRIDGVAYDGECYYFAGANNLNPSQIYVFDQHLEYVRQFTQAGESRYGMKDLEWDGELLWGSGDTVIYGFTRDGEVVRRFRPPLNPCNNIAYDNRRDILWACGTTTDIYGINMAGEVVDTLQRARFRCYGLGWDATDPDGYYLQILHNPGGGEAARLYRMNPETNDTSFIAIFPAVENATGASGLYVLPRRNDLGKTEALTTINVAPAFGGDKMARIMLRPNREWIALDPASGALEPEEEEAIGVTLRTGSDEADWLFPLGVYRAEISVSSPNLSGILIPVTLTVTPLAAPVEVEAAPSETVLTTLYPQPFNSGLAIEYRLARRGEVSLKLFDLAGREAGVIEEGMREAGDHSVRFDAGELASGIYWIRLEAGGLMSVRKAALVR